jgi:hypothetical protein
LHRLPHHASSLAPMSITLKFLIPDFAL